MYKAIIVNTSIFASYKGSMSNEQTSPFLKKSKPILETDDNDEIPVVVKKAMAKKPVQVYTEAADDSDDDAPVASYKVHSKKPTKHSMKYAQEVSDEEPAMNYDYADVEPVSDTAPASYAAPVAVQPKAVQNVITNEEQFWNFVEKLAWRDVSEDNWFNMAQKKQVFKRLSMADQEKFAEYLLTFVADLNTHLKTKTFYPSGITDEVQNAICAHIIGKGSVFYVMTRDDPVFASYLIPEGTNPKIEYRNLLELVEI